MTNLLDEEKPPRWFVFLMAIIITVAVMMALTSCGPAFKLRKAERLIKQAEAQGAKWKSDTVYQEKKVIVPGDSVRIEIPMWSKVKDTVIYNDRVRLRIQNVHDTVRVTAECLPDTVFVNVPVTVNKSIVAPPCPKDKFWKGVGFGAGGILILLIILAISRLLK